MNTTVVRVSFQPTKSNQIITKNSRSTKTVGCALQSPELCSPPTLQYCRLHNSGHQKGVPKKYVSRTPTNATDHRQEGAPTTLLWRPGCCYQNHLLIIVSTFLTQKSCMLTAQLNLLTPSPFSYPGPRGVVSSTHPCLLSTMYLCKVEGNLQVEGSLGWFCLVFSFLHFLGC